MNINEIANGFITLCASGKLEEAQKYWSDEIVSIEGFPGPMQVCRGREAVLKKQAIWGEGTTMHGITCEGPFINGEQFAARFQLDCTNAEGERSTMTEMAVYTVENGAIVQERFFPTVS
ncbi:MAG: nuclear transport factor 2 family protein [Planctomycetota bacterium]